MTKRLALLALLAGVLVAVPGPHDTARAAFAGKNGRIAFVRAAGAGPLEEVFMVSPASGLTANLSNDPATSDTAPAWSPDGTRVAFQRSGLTDGIWTMDATGGGDAELWMVRADGSDLTSSPTTATRTGRPAGPRTAPASPSPARARAARPASCCWTWAPAARSPLPRPAASTPPRLVARRQADRLHRFLPGEGNRIFTVAPSGKALTQRTFGGPNDVHPSWSPDGTRIAFARAGDQDDGLPFHLHTVTLASGKTTQVTSGRVVDLLPSWQPQ